MKTIIVTGAAGFIGAFLCKRILEQDERVCLVGVDNMNAYYDVAIKRKRLEMIGAVDAPSSEFVFMEGDIADDAFLNLTFGAYRPTAVINLAAQAGVRYSIENPRAYLDSNIIGFYNVLEACRRYGVDHLVFASSSSVYGGNQKVPYSENDRVDNPASFYAVTKKSNELMAYAYSKLYGIPCTGLRFFTVYGPMGRPDMAYFKFTNKIVRGDPIQIYNMGDMRRDFTYIDDIVEGVVDIMAHPPEPDANNVRYKVYNIGNSSPVRLLDFVETLERVLVEEGVVSGPTKHELLPMQPGDVYQTYADVSALEHDFGFKPQTLLEDGLREFARWYKGYYGSRIAMR